MEGAELPFAKKFCGHPNLTVHNFQLQVLIGEKITWFDLTHSLFWILYLNASIMLGVPGHVLVHPGVAHPSRAGHLSRLGIHILNTILWMNERVLVHPGVTHRAGYLSRLVIHILNTIIWTHSSRSHSPHIQSWPSIQTWHPHPEYNLVDEWKCTRSSMITPPIQSWSSVNCCHPCSKYFNSKWKIVAEYCFYISICKD